MLSPFLLCFGLVKSGGKEGRCGRLAFGVEVVALRLRMEWSGW